MRNVVLVVLNLACMGFVLVFVLALLNFLFGLHLGIKGTKVPGDPGAAIAFLVVAVICGGMGVLVNRRAMNSEARIEEAGRG
jgi:hypothetical protein